LISDAEDLAPINDMADGGLPRIFWQERVGPDDDIWDVARVLGGVYGYLQPDPDVP